MKQKIIKINSNDNVWVALANLQKNEVLSTNKNDSITLISDVQSKHKFFENDMPAEATIIMYGVTIGKTKFAVKKGEVLTTDNVYHAVQTYAYRNFNYQWNAPNVQHLQHLTFNGYHRSDGTVGTANYWLFIPTVFCENRNLEVIKEAMLAPLGYALPPKYYEYTQQLIKALHNSETLDNAQFQPSNKPLAERVFTNIDGIKFLNHQGGCGGIRQDAAVLSKLMAAYANHPNVGGVTILSLGCQNLQTNELLADIKSVNPNFNKSLLVYEQQQSSSEEQLITTAIKDTFEQLIQINNIERQPAPISKLTVGVKCGGSDGFSGISANPSVGYCSDLLVALGAKVLLAEFPELCGVEQELVDRCTNETIANKFSSLMKQYEKNVVAVGSGFHMNPSPGNIKDGLITDAMKSAGAAKKGGTAPIVDVLDYTEIATKPGLNLVCTPGNDVEATTGKAASGATLILFTTGLGTPTGNPVCPTIKVSTNSVLTKRMNDIIDIDCGPVIEGEKTIEQMGEEILLYCIEAASGNIIPKAVQLQQDDFIPWKRGVSL
jgi:altronate hydrolase